jgi:hypothetical protein
MTKKEQFDQAVEKHAEIAKAFKKVKLKAPKGGNKYHKEGETFECSELVAKKLIEDKKYTEVK